MKLNFCKSQGEKHWCIYLRSPLFHSGYTGKSGPETMVEM